MKLRKTAGWVLVWGLLAVTAARAGEIEVGGRVLLPWGEPLAEAEVRLDPLISPLERLRALLEEDAEPIAPVARARTDAEGRFRLAAPNPGLWTVRVEASGFVPLEFELEPLIEPVELPDAEMSTDSGLTVTVTGGGATALAGAGVVVRSERERYDFLDRGSWKVPLRVGRSGADGKLRLPRGENERASVSAAHEGFVVAERRGVYGTAARLDLARATPRPIVVRSAEGRPVAGVMLALGERRHPVGLTDERGRLDVALVGKSPTAAALLAGDGRRLTTRLEPSDWNEDGSPRALVLPDRLAVAGRLIDADTRRAIAAGVVWDAGNPAEGFVTDDAGGFVLTGPAGSRLEVEAGAPGYLRDHGIEFQLADDGRPGPTLALQPAAAIEGKVVDAEGEPVAGAAVELAVQRPPSGGMRIEIGRPTLAPRALSGPSGTFRLGPVDPDQAYEVKVRAAGFAPASETVTGLEPRRTKKGVRVRLDRGRAVAGVVADEDDIPLRDVEVLLRPQQSRGGMGMLRIMDSTAPPAEFLGSTDGRGAFRIEGLPQGKFDLEAARPGFATKKVGGVEVGSEGPLTDLGTITLEPGQRVQGIVTDRDGLPLEGVEVYAASGGPTMTMVMSGASFDEPEPDAVTDPTGWFTLSDLAAGEPYSFRFHRVGFTDGSAKAVELPRMEPLEVRLEAASDVSGTVVDREGEPIAGAQVNLRRAKTIEMGGAVMKTVMMSSEQTDAAGRFLFADQEPGPVSLSAVASGYQEAKLDNVDIPKGEDVSGVELLLPAGAIVQGRVLLPDGRPAIGAEVREVIEDPEPIHFGGQPTDGNGYYRIEGLVPGKVSIEATHDTWPRVVRDLEVDEGIHTLDLQLEGGVEVSGRVSSLDGDPVADAVVRLAPVGRVWGGPEARTAADGGFEMPGVEDGEYDLWVEAFDFAPFPGERRISVAGEPLYGLEVTLDEGVRVVGRVTGIDPERLAEVSVTAQGTSFESWNSSAVDSRGNYRIEHLRPGSYNLVAMLGDSGRRAKEQVALEPGMEELSTDLAFDDGLVLSGRVVQDKAPVAGVMVMVEGLDVDRGGWGQTGEQGGFAVEGLEPGRYHVKLRDWETGLAHDETLDLSTSREIEIEVPGGSVAGRMRDSSDRQPLAGVALTLEPENEEVRGHLPTHTATTDLTGSFRLPNVADGEWRLSAVKQGYAAVSRGVVLRSGRAETLDVTMDPTEGMTLETRLPSGSPPDEVRVAVLDPSGAALVAGVYATGENGRVRLSSVPAGTWEVVVSAAGSATANVRANAPGEAIPVALPPPSGLRVRVPELQASNLVATVFVKDAQGNPFRSLEWSGRPLSDYRMLGGQLEFSALPPGTWSVTVATADGRSWQGQSATAGGTTAELVLE